MVVPERKKLKDVLYMDLDKSYTIEQVSKHFLRICNQKIRIDDLRNETKIITIDYEGSQMLGFQLRQKSEQLQYRWFKFNTLSKSIYHGLWHSILLSMRVPIDVKPI